ncbi:MAG: hypothetical protein Q4B27_00355 [Candidatus Saccharibacteria bacterium]|nr:hypothetical protein [Candidatus Saccharibacteria bacterium]
MREKPNQTYEPYQENQSQAEHTPSTSSEMTAASVANSPQEISIAAIAKRIKSWWKERHWRPGDPFYTVGPIDPGDPVANVYPKSARKFLRDHEMTCREYDITTS